MQITIVAHASVLIETGADKVLIDPIFSDVFASDTLCFHPARKIDTTALVESTTVLVVSHMHLDHFHPPTLQLFARDIPLIVPTHDALINIIRSLGFTNVIPLAPWQHHDIESARLMATPSDFEMEELGLVVAQCNTRYWHMSDAIVTEAVGQRVKREFGAMSLVSVKYQPLRTLIGYQRGLQSMVLDRDEMVDTFEAASATEPAFVFPYFSGFAFHGEHAWANRHVAPYDANEIARLLQRRLGDNVAVQTVLPGDELQIENRSVVYTEGASEFVETAEGPDIQCWEPIDESTLRGPAATSDREWLAQALQQLLLTEVLPWVWFHLSERTGLFDGYQKYQAIWQCVVHAGDGQRLNHAVDFRTPAPEAMVNFVHPDANVFSHISGHCLVEVLRGNTGAEVFWMAGGYRMYEKLLLIDDGHFVCPEQHGWELYEQLPDPVTHYLRKVGMKRRKESQRKRAEAGAA